MEETFEEALATLFDLDAEPDPEPTDQPGPDEEPDPGDDEPTSTLDELIAEAGRIYEQAQQALSDGDFETYGRLIERLGRILTEAQRLSQ
jgi:uncharacterized membrane protein (UPF0182 family)